MVWIWSNSSTNVVFDGHEMTAEVRIPRRGLSTAGVELWIRDRVQYQALERAASDELSRMAELRKARRPGGKARDVESVHPFTTSPRSMTSYHDLDIDP
jgi:hypothetical protein